MARARPLLRLSEDDVRGGEVRVLEEEGTVVGWVRVTLRGVEAELEDLWLEPPAMGRGWGRLQFDHAVRIAIGAGAASLEWDAEPFARGFYEAMGGIEIGRTPSAVEPGRTLPRMRLELPLTPRRRRSRG